MSLLRTAPEKNLRHQVQLVKNRHYHQIETLLIFYIDNDLKKEHILEVNKVKKVFFTTDNNQIKETTKKKNKQLMPTMVITPLLPRTRTSSNNTNQLGGLHDFRIERG